MGNRHKSEPDVFCFILADLHACSIFVWILDRDAVVASNFKWLQILFKANLTCNRANKKQQKSFLRDKKATGISPFECKKSSIGICHEKSCMVHPYWFCSIYIFLQSILNVRMSNYITLSV